MGHDTHWNEVTLFGKLIEHTAKSSKGDLVHSTGRVHQKSYDTAEGRRYTVELIADGFAVPAQGFRRWRLGAVGAAYRRPFSSAKLQLDRFPDEVGLAFAFPQNGLDAP